MEKLFTALDGDEVYISKWYSINDNADIVTLLLDTHGAVGELHMTKSQAERLAEALQEKANV